MVISNVKNKYEKGGPGSDNPNALPLNHKDIHFDIPAAKAIIQRVLKPKYEELHKSEGFLYVGLIFESSGKLSDISFGVMRDTPISLKDLAEIDDRLRKTLSATYTGNEFKDHKIFVYSLGSTFF